MTDALTAVPPRPSSTYNPFDIDSLATQLLSHVSEDPSSPRFSMRLAGFVGHQYVDIPTVAAARRLADAVLEGAFPTQPPPHSSTYRYVIALPAKEYSGWDQERCQRLCAAIFTAYRERYQAEGN
jgi:hypothetical protein